MTIGQLNDYAQMLVLKLPPVRGYSPVFTPFSEKEDRPTNLEGELWLKKDGAGGAGQKLPIYGFDFLANDFEWIKTVEQSIFNAYRESKKILPPMRLARDFPNGFTLKAMHDICGGEAETWEAYFLGGFDDEVRTQFENAQQPGARVTAVIMRAAMKVMK